jgi:hypothetical protein
MKNNLFTKIDLLENCIEKKIYKFHIKNYIFDTGLFIFNNKLDQKFLDIHQELIILQFIMNDLLGGETDEKR